MCGEKERRAGFGGGRTGSPPRVRGKADVCSTLKIPTRITPACAGKSNALLDLPAGQRDHPRVCGEKRKDRLDYYVPQGSPPHVRGKGLVGFELDIRIRITPACAGKRGCADLTADAPRDHPPHVRGKDVPVEAFAQTWRITPVYAGKRLLQTSRKGRTRDHPRVCGEKGIFTCLMAFLMGSPPRMRGKAQGIRPRLGVHGITPACAGKSSPSCCGSWRCRDHPRVCGEKPTQTAPTPVSPISSMARWVTRVPGPSSSTEMPAAGI